VLVLLVPAYEHALYDMKDNNAGIKRDRERGSEREREREREKERGARPAVSPFKRYVTGLN